ncbi:unnamed protein product [Clonostachys byssicola]|uniref:Uncharacterized protein n=1 Tax=Clonostachys byssicola TaxID=160290 RepID=A0A9N9U9H1_9HYPO|nr:unnamed protein product [Clonostachys byssicola]
MLSRQFYGLCVVGIAVAKLPESPGCGDINVLYTYRFSSITPYVVEQGWDPVAVDAGYNTRILMGPDEDVSQLEARFQDVESHMTGIGFGMRPATIPEISTRFKDNNFLF